MSVLSDTARGSAVVQGGILVENEAKKRGAALAREILDTAVDNGHLYWRKDVEALLNLLFDAGRAIRGDEKVDTSKLLDEIDGALETYT